MAAVVYLLPSFIAIWRWRAVCWWNVPAIILMNVVFGWAVNAKRVCRLYREMGLQLRCKTPKRRVKAKLRSDRTTARSANDIWAMDFVHDQLFDGTRIRALTIVDTLSRLAPAIGVRRSYRGIDVVDTLERGAAEFGYPRRSVSTTALSSSVASSTCGRT
jgi:transposase InsO family protein